MASQDEECRLIQGRRRRERNLIFKFRGTIEVFFVNIIYSMEKLGADKLTKSFSCGIPRP